MKIALFVLASFLLVALVAAKTESEYQSLWADFVTKNERQYSSIEAVRRYNIFKTNVDFVDTHNADSTKTFKVGINKFADLTSAEFGQMYNGFNMSSKRAAQQFNGHSSAVPTSWDWRTKGAVTPIKNQGQCGSCWAFSTVGSTEGCHFITTGKLVSLSEQNLVDCSTAEGNQGCNGGLMDNGFEYIIKNKGIDTEAGYPYHAEDGKCHYEKKFCGSLVGSYADVTPSGDETALQKAVYSSPTSVAIDASQSSFQLYTSGVYYEPACSSQQLDHGVLAVGYGTESGSEFWIVKNSWGTDWGMSGYILMSRNRKNNCGIATMASLPSGCGNC